MRFSRRRFLAFMGGGVACGSVYAFGLEPIWTEVTEHELTLPRLPASLDGYTVVQLSDLHVGDSVPRSHLERAVDTANSFAPDLIAVTGDLTDEAADPRSAAEAAEILAGLRTRDGVYAVTGNHDTGAYREGYRADPSAVDRLEAPLAEAGVKLLHNATHMVERGRARLRVTGLGDLWSDGFDPRGLTPGGFTLALSHNPDTAPLLAKHDVDLVLSGHTHGGQVSFPLFGPPWIPLKNKQFLAGHFRLGKTQLYVNRGLGWSHRIRFCARPEVSVFTLRALGAHSSLS